MVGKKPSCGRASGRFSAPSSQGALSESMACLQRPKASARKPESVFGKHDAWMQQLTASFMRPNGRTGCSASLRGQAAAAPLCSFKPNRLICSGFIMELGSCPCSRPTGRMVRGRGECQPKHRARNRNRFTESTMRRFNNLQRPQCVRMDARRCSAGRAKRWRPARILVRGGLGSLGQGQPPSSMMVGSRRAPV